MFTILLSFYLDFTNFKYVFFVFFKYEYIQKKTVYSTSLDPGRDDDDDGVTTRWMTALIVVSVLGRATNADAITNGWKRSGVAPSGIGDGDQ